VTQPDDGRRSRRLQTQSDAEAASDAVVDTQYFGAVSGTEGAYDSGVMLTTNSSAPELPVSPYGSADFDALALGETTSSVGTKVDFSRGTARDGGLFACPADCSGRGACLADIGECMCLLGSSGPACEIASPTVARPQPSTPTPSPHHPPSPLHPPFTPLNLGESIVTVVATVVTVGITIAGSVEAFDETARTNLASTLKDALRCREPSCFLELRVSPGSVQVAAVLTIPDAEAGSAAAAADIAAAASTLASSDSSSLSSTLGVTVTAIAAPTVQQAVSVPLVVAPPPPSPPPSPLPPPSQPLSSSPMPLPEGSRPGESGGGTTTIIIAATTAAGGVALLLFAGVYVRRRRRKPREEEPVQIDGPASCFPRALARPSVQRSTKKVWV